MSVHDVEMQCSWLSFGTYFIHFLLGNKSPVASLLKEDVHILDPDLHGIPVVVSSPKQADNITSSFVRKIQEINLEIYYDLLRLVLLEKTEPLLGPAILEQPSTIFEHEDENAIAQKYRVPKSCMKDTDDITNIFSDILARMEKHHVFPAIIKQFFVQLYYSINAMLLNRLVTNGNDNDDDIVLCTCSNGFHIKYAIAQLIAWISSNAKIINAQKTKAQLNPIVDAANLLVMDKSIFSDAEIIKEAFPTLNAAQLLDLLDRFQPDQLSSEKVPLETKKVLSNMMLSSLQKMEVEIDPFALLPFHE